MDPERASGSDEQDVERRMAKSHKPAMPAAAGVNLKRIIAKFKYKGISKPGIIGRTRSTTQRIRSGSQSNLLD